MKRFMVFVLTAVMLCSFATPAFAADPPLATSQPMTSAPTVGTPAKGTVGSAQEYLLMSMMSTIGINVIIYRNSITEYSSGYLRMFGYTETDMIADTIKVNFTLQQWNGSSWVTYSTSNNTDTNNDIFSQIIYRYVAHGYYYRVKTYHEGNMGYYTDNTTLYSSYIYVS